MIGIPPAQFTLEEHIWALAELERPVRISEARAVVTELRALIEHITEQCAEAESEAWYAGRDFENPDY